MPSLSCYVVNVLLSVLFNVCFAMSVFAMSVFAMSVFAISVLAMSVLPSCFFHLCSNLNIAEVLTVFQERMGRQRD